jgi:alpha-ketoglutarate-dependent taurine dioxygenase
LALTGALRRGDFLILDNTRVHHAKVAGSIVEGMLSIVGVRLVVLPAYK